MSALTTSDSESFVQYALQPCWLLEPCGTPLTRGRCSTVKSGEGILHMEVTEVEHPGRLVQRCLTGSVRTVWVYLEDGRQFLAQVERVAFDPKTGRRCLLSHLAPGVLPGMSHGPV